MKKSLKFLARFFIFGAVYFALGTRYSAFGTVFANTGAVSYTGTLSQFLTQGQNEVSTAFNTTYQRVYAQFQASGLNLMNTLNYQSLVCLGVMKPDDSIISQMQKDGQTLRLSFLQGFLDVDSEIAALEDKNRIQGDTNISLFDYGTSYTSESAAIAQEITQLRDKRLATIQNFENTYTQKSQTFIQDVLAYTRQNTGMLSFINDKISKIQSIDNSFSLLTSGVNQINTLLVGTGADFMASAESIRTGFMNDLTARLQPLIDAAVKAHSNIPGLDDALMSEKDFAVLNYGLDFDEKMNDILDTRYNKTAYENIKTQIAQLKTDFMNSGQLNCSKIYTTPTIFDTRVNSLLTQVNAAMSGIALSAQTLQTAGCSQAVKATLLSGFAEFNTQNLSTKITEFKKIISDKVAGITTTPNMNVTTSTSSNVSTTNMAGVVFTRPFKKGEVGTAIKNLQQLLTNNGYYSGAINGIYTSKTIEGVYRFQMANGLLAGYEKKSATRGRMGPMTRAKLNALAASQ